MEYASTADRLLDEADFAEAQMLILPGGIPGTPNLRACDTLCQQLQQFAKEEKMGCSGVCSYLPCLVNWGF